MVEYVGSRYAGFQRQPGRLTVQSALEEAIAAVTGSATAVAGSGRTDAGAHACHQVIAFSTDSTLPPATLQRALNANLPRDIAVATTREVAGTFHPRYDAFSRTYRYVIWNRPQRSPFLEKRAAHVAYRLDERAMDRAAGSLVGRRDLSAFAPVAMRGGCERQVFAAGCRREGDVVTIEVEASGFMRQMMRALAGTLIRVGGGRLSVQEFEQVVQSGDRRQAASTAPAHGLYLVKVKYGALECAQERSGAQDPLLLSIV